MRGHSVSRFLKLGCLKTAFSCGSSLPLCCALPVGASAISSSSLSTCCVCSIPRQFGTLVMVSPQMKTELLELRGPDSPCEVDSFACSTHHPMCSLPVVLQSVSLLTECLWSLLVSSRGPHTALCLDPTKRDSEHKSLGWDLIAPPKSASCGGHCQDREVRKCLSGAWLVARASLPRFQVGQTKTSKTGGHLVSFSASARLFLSGVTSTCLWLETDRGESENQRSGC